MSILPEHGLSMWLAAYKGLGLYPAQMERPTEQVHMELWALTHSPVSPRHSPSPYLLVLGVLGIHSPKYLASDSLPEEDKCVLVGEWAASLHSEFI